MGKKKKKKENEIKEVSAAQECVGAAPAWAPAPASC